MPKHKTLTLHQKVCLIEKADKSEFSRTKLAEKHQMPLQEDEDSRGLLQDALHIAFTNRLPTYVEVKDTLITWHSCYANTESDNAGSVADVDQDDSDFKPTRAFALEKVVQLLGGVCSFVECVTVAIRKCLPGRHF